eukprot:5775482-Pleurochrysis_carterae.AAC.1
MIDAVVHEMMSSTDAMAATDAKKLTAMRMICSKYVARHSSTGYAIGAKFRLWLDAEIHGKEEQSLDNELLGFVVDMLAICGSRDYIFFSTQPSQSSASRRPAAC